MGLLLAVAVTFLHQDATAQGTTINLGTASSFALLAGAGITVAGPVNSTTINGDIGSFGSTTAITGLENVVLNGVDHAGDLVTQGAKLDLTAAYIEAAMRSPTTAFLSDDNQLGGLSLAPGVYTFGHANTANLIGTLKLDANGMADPVWIFQATSDFITASGSKVELLNGATSCDVFWQVGSSSTQLGTDSDFVGNILALTSISAKTGATVDGRLLARNGTVTLDNNTFFNACVVPELGSSLLLGFGLATLFVFRRRSYQ
jgi:hypothetical protein